MVKGQKTTVKATMFTKQSADEVKINFPLGRRGDSSCLYARFQNASCSKNFQFMVIPEKTVRQFSVNKDAPR